MTDISPYSFQEENYLKKKPFSRGNVMPLENLSEKQLEILKLVGNYGALTRQCIEVFFSEGKLYTEIKKLCEFGILNAYEKCSADSAGKLTFYCINKTKVTSPFIKEISFREDTYTGKDALQIIQLLSINQWHIFFLRDYDSIITKASLADNVSSIKCKDASRKNISFIAMRYIPGFNNLALMEQMVRRAERLRLFKGTCYFVIITDATGGLLKEACAEISSSALASYPILYTTDLHINKGYVCDWMFLCSKEDGHFKRFLISIL